MKLRLKASVSRTSRDLANVMERLNFTIIDGEDRPLHEPGRRPARRRDGCRK